MDKEIAQCVDYWTKDKNVILISDIKERYLNLLRNNKMKLSKISKEIGTTPRNTEKRLLELRRFGLAKRDESKQWILNKTNKEIWIIKRS